MRSIAIIALVFSAISIIVPIVGVYLAMLCSVLAFISFYSQPTLSGITFGLNILSTLFLSPTIYLQAGMAETNTQEGGSQIFSFYIGFHFILLLLAILVLSFKRLKKKSS